MYRAAVRPTRTPTLFSSFREFVVRWPVEQVETGLCGTAGVFTEGDDRMHPRGRRAGTYLAAPAQLRLRMGATLAFSFVLGALTPLLMASNAPGYAPGAQEDQGASADLMRFPVFGLQRFMLSSGCGTQGPPTGVFTMQSKDGNNMARTALVQAPANYTPLKAYALVFVFHGAGAEFRGGLFMGLAKCSGGSGKRDLRLSPGH